MSRLNLTAVLKLVILSLFNINNNSSFFKIIIFLAPVTTQRPITTTLPYTCPVNQVDGDLSKTNASLSTTIYEIVNNIKNNIGSIIYVGNSGFTPSQPGGSIFIDMPTTASSFVS